MHHLQGKLREGTSPPQPANVYILPVHPTGGQVTGWYGYLLVASEGRSSRAPTR
ncbi:MAG: hypothetical protein WKF75_07030 [Singulisphaera sp.]